MVVPFQDPASLDNLNDIVVPEPTAWWPTAAGWIVLGSLIIVAALMLTVRAFRQWQRNRYRRAALHELEQLQARVGKVDAAEAVASLDQIIKRTALVNWPRSTVAALSGKPWIEFLNSSAKKELFSSEEGEMLNDVVYSSNRSAQLTAAQVDQLFDAAKNWIRSHRLPVESPS